MTSTRQRQAMAAHPSGGTREIERRGVHITVNVARQRSRTRNLRPGAITLVPLQDWPPSSGTASRNRPDKLAASPSVTSRGRKWS